MDEYRSRCYVSERCDSWEGEINKCVIPSALTPLPSEIITIFTSTFQGNNIIDPLNENLVENRNQAGQAACHFRTACLACWGRRPGLPVTGQAWKTWPMPVTGRQAQAGRVGGLLRALIRSVLSILSCYCWHYLLRSMMFSLKQPRQENLAQYELSVADFFAVAFLDSFACCSQIVTYEPT